MQESAKQVAGGLLFAVVGLFTVIGSVEMGIGNPNQPGPGFFPVVIGAAILLLSSIALIGGALQRTASRPAEPDVAVPDGGSKAAVLALVVAMIVYCLLLEYAGFLICTFGFAIAMQALAQPVEFKLKFLLPPLFMTVAMYLVFEVALKVGLPAGQWWR